MRKIVQIIPLLFLCFLTVQAQPSKSSYLGFPKLKGDANCIYKAKLNAAQRKKIYPFNIADTVKLVSFHYHRKNYPVTKDSLITDSLIEVRTLSKQGIDSLTDILYNNFYKLQPNIETSTQCFFPRNGIVFMDKRGIVKEYILICFHCATHDESTDKVNFGDHCDQKVEKLRKFFINEGLSFGTDKGVNQYPGEGSDEKIALPEKH